MYAGNLENLSTSQQVVLRGLHYQITLHAQGKPVRVVDEKVFDVAVDVRQSSPRYDSGGSASECRE
jgi:dTDP-4-dehydrorhamnose 3,5-epimerase